MANLTNVFSQLPSQLDDEQFTTLLDSNGIKIERILSMGQVTPQGQWYEDIRAEWVLLIQGQAELEFADGSRVKLAAGDHINIAARQKHRVSWTHPQQLCLWLAIYYQEIDA